MLELSSNNMKAIQVYLSKNNYKILTMYRLESWSYLLSEPIFILPENINKKILTEKIFYALDSSREISQSEENNYRLGKDLLRKLKETSFDKLYNTSVSCSVFLNNNILTVTPHIYLGKGSGLGEVTQSALKINYNGKNKNEITTQIIRLLKE